MVIELKQNWWHITDTSYSEYPAKHIHQIMDFFTNETPILFRFNKKFLGLKVFSRNSSSNEIGFIWDDNGSFISLNLNLAEFPDVPQLTNVDNIPDLKHVKLELDGSDNLTVDR